MGYERPNLGSERSNLGSQRPNLRFERLYFRSGRPDLGSERPAFGSLRPHLGSERPNLGQKRFDFRYGKPGLIYQGGNGQMDRWTRTEENCPTTWNHRSLAPLEPLPNEYINHSKTVGYQIYYSPIIS